jgi:hypothetical protein
MKMILSMRLGILDALFEDFLGLLDKLAVQINRVGLNAPVGIILAEDKLRRLPVVLLHLTAMRLSLLGELFGAGAIAARVRFLRLMGVCVSACKMPQLRPQLRLRALGIGLWHTRE